MSDLTRRTLLAAGIALPALALAGCAPAPSLAPTAPPVNRPSPTPSVLTSDAFAELEAEFAARLGVYAIDTGTGTTVEHRADERFAFCSTIKALAAAIVLDATTPEELERRVPVTAADLRGYSPIAEQHVGGDLSIAELCAATVQYSDNAAHNILVREHGGLTVVQQALLDAGDQVTRLDREEPELSSAIPGDPRDTSTPRALATSLRGFALDGMLDTGDTEVLTGWLRGSTTGDALIRAGVPGDWIVGDKTGSGGYGTRNDIAILWRPDAAPISLALLSDKGVEGAERSDELIARAAAAVATLLTSDASTDKEPT